MSTFWYKVLTEILANNSDFCLSERNGLGSRQLSVSNCKNVKTIIMFFPHFYQPDKVFVSATEGMHPNKKDCETSVDINLLAAIIPRPAKRCQINIYDRS
jgi:hypothetical protein